MREIVKAATQLQLDGFDTFDDTIEGEEERGSGLIQGDRIKFTNQAEWVFANNNTKLPPHLELLVWDILRVVQKWPVEPGPPLEERVLESEKIPDIKRLNEAAPKEEWRMGPNGQLQGPYQFQYVVYLFHEPTAAQYTWCSGTTGAAICLRDLAKRSRFKRDIYGTKMHAIVTLTDTFMPTRYGGRQRPAFDYKRWVKIGSGEQVALPATDKAAPLTIEQSLDRFADGDKPTAKPEAAKPAGPQTTGKAQTSTKPSAKDVTGDEIIY
jgi:hypothetical protein